MSGGLIAQASQYLAYNEPVRSADALVLLVGEDMRARRMAAHELLCAGRAQRLLVPAYIQVFACSSGRVVSAPPVGFNDLAPKTPARGRGIPKWVEDTHVELLLARRTLEDMGMRSVIFVSSPYHMRRIKIMADRVFAGFDTCYVATPHEHTRGRLWWTDRRDIRWVLSEYVKITWFLIYAPLFEMPAGK